jgi:hypothetical protein
MNNDSSMLEFPCSDSANNSSFSRCFSQMDLHRQEKLKDSRLGLKCSVREHARILLEIRACVQLGALGSSLSHALGCTSEEKTGRYLAYCSK